MSDPARLFRAVLRQDLSAFTEKTFLTLEPGTAYQHNWHIDHLCWQLARVARGELRRLIITVPPRSMKLITVSVGFTAWLMGHDPTKRVICVSYAEDLARKLSVDARTLMTSPWYRALFPGLQFASRQPRTMELVTTQQGYRFAAGMNGAILGRGADLIVIDDPIKATDALSQAERRRVNEAFDNTFYTRLNNKSTGAIVMIMQRLHEDDLVGHVLASGDWEVVAIPAIATEDRTYRLSDHPGDVYFRRAGEVLHASREPREILEGIRRAQGSLVFSAQYQQAPIPPEGNIIKREWLRSYDEPPSMFRSHGRQLGHGFDPLRDGRLFRRHSLGCEGTRLLAARPGARPLRGAGAPAPGDRPQPEVGRRPDRDRSDRHRPGNRAGPAPVQGMPAHSAQPQVRQGGALPRAVRAVRGRSGACPAPGALAG